LQVRKDKAEKRLSDANREAELMREKLQRKLDDSQTILKRKEKEFEDTMDHLQKDLDSLESERGELKNKLKETTMKVLLEGIARGSSPSMSSRDSISAASMGPMSMGPSIPAPVKDSPMLMRQLQDLQLALTAIKEDSYRLLLLPASEALRVYFLLCCCCSCCCC
jgi:dynactin 1